MSAIQDPPNWLDNEAKGTRRVVDGIEQLLTETMKQVEEYRSLEAQYDELQAAGKDGEDKHDEAMYVLINMLFKFSGPRIDALIEGAHVDEYTEANINAMLEDKVNGDLD